MLSRRGRSELTQVTPRARCGKIGVAVIEISIRSAERSRKASPHEHRVAGPDCGVIGTGDRSTRKRNRLPAIGGRVISPSVAEVALSRINSTPDNYFRPRPYRARAFSVDGPSRRSQSVCWRPRISNRIVAPTRTAVVLAGDPSPDDHDGAGPDGDVVATTKRRIDGRNGRPVSCQRIVARS